jgi:hypothetical protein
VNQVDIRDIKLAAQTALLGEVIPQLIFVALEVGDAVTVVYCLDRHISPEEKDDLDAATTELIAHWPDIGFSSTFIVGTDFTATTADQILVYQRKKIGKYRDDTDLPC